MSEKLRFVPLLLALSLLLAACAQATPAPTAAPTEPPTTAPSPTSPPAATETPSPEADLEGFVIELIQAFDAQDFDRLQALMGDPFTFGFWGGEGVAYTPAEAAEQLRTNYLGPETDPVFDRDLDFASILGGTEPETLAGPVEVAELIFVDGFGLEGNDEAILFIARRSDGSLYWHSILIAGGGFSGGAGAPEEGVVETDVQYVRPEEEVFIRSGPGTEFEVIGSVAGGQTALVTGASPDGQWWRVICPDDTIGDCWVSAEFAQPADAP